jgi:hypothetical protein
VEEEDFRVKEAVLEKEEDNCINYKNTLVEEDI